MLKKVEKSHNEMLDVLYWRVLFDELYLKAPDFERKQLVVYDNFFLTAVGKDCVRNVKAGKAGLLPTKKVVEALKKLIEAKELDKTNVDGLIKRQKLVIP